MGRFENFTPLERGVMREAMLFSESEFYDPGHTREAQVAIRNLIREIEGKAPEDPRPAQRAATEAANAGQGSRPTFGPRHRAAPTEAATEVKTVGQDGHVGTAVNARESMGAGQRAAAPSPTPARPEPREQWAIEKPTRKVFTSDDPPRYKGFLLIRCMDCGSVHAFCTKEPISSYYCRECGSRTPLDNMHRLRLFCECGNRSTYWTNLTDDVMDVNCIQCGAPVAMEWNGKAGQYKTIGWEKPRKGARRE